MRHYLIVYDRREGRIERQQHYKTAADALQARFDAEREFAGRADIEVVVLGGKSWRAVQHTHSRYFKAVQDLARVGLDRLTVASS